MQQHTFLQGTPQWHAHRATARNASDAPAVLGCSTYLTRSQLLHARHTGLRAETTPDQERIFAAGHAIEKAQMEGAEAFIGQSLYPVVGTAVVDGIELSASFDGLTMMEDVAYECKTLNDALRVALSSAGPEANDAAALPKMYRVQMEQQLAVCGGERVLFVAATKDGADVRRCWYYPDLALRAEIVAAWRQFDADLAAYVPPAAPTVEKVVAEAVESLPAVFVKVEGSIVIHENFDVFEKAARHFLENRLIRAPKTDQDFATLEAQIKDMKGAEGYLDNAEASWIAQIETVAEKKRRKDMLRSLVRDNRLMAEKLLASEKERRRTEIVTSGSGALLQHVAALNKRLGKSYMPSIPADFGGCVKGLKSLVSMEDKVSTELARAKIAANEIADRIQINLDALRELAHAHAFLFADTAALVLKAPDDCRAVITSRIADHKAEQDRKLEAERARIRAEEEARAQRQAQEKAAAEEAERQRIAAAETEQRRLEAARADAQRQEQDALERRQREDAAARAEPQRQQPAPEPAAPVSTVDAFTEQRSSVVPMPTRAPAAPAGPPTLKLGEIQRRLAANGIEPNLSAAFLAAIGVPCAGRDRAAVMFHEHQFDAICDALIAHVAAAQRQQQAA